MPHLFRTTGLIAGIMVLTMQMAVPQSAVVPAFEVATIKKNVSVGNAIGNRFAPELLTYTNVTLRTLIEQSHGLKDYQIIGAPDWVNSEKWDIQAKSSGSSTFRQKLDMVKTLIAERFRLKFHTETRQLPIYVLLAVKDGPKFQTAIEDDLPTSLRIGTGLISGHKYDVSALPAILSGQLNIPVVDQIGLKGTYDFKIEWMPLPNEGNFSTTDNVNDSPAPLSTGPSIFTALQEQLGLKLERSKGPVEVLIIDSVERPTEN